MNNKSSNVIHISDYNKNKLTDQENFINHSFNNEQILCPSCGIVSIAGHWQWDAALPSFCKQQLCPACQRISDDNPAGYLSLSGDYFHRHRIKIFSLISTIIENQIIEDPLSRLIEVDKHFKKSVILSFTDEKLPLKIGQTIASAFHGLLDIENTYITGIVRVKW